MNHLDDAILQANVENNFIIAMEHKIESTWISFPTTKEHIQEAFKEIGVDENDNSGLSITECELNIGGDIYSLPRNSHIDELNYLADIVISFDEDKFELLGAVLSISSDLDMKDIINIANNLDCYELQPVFDERDYGDFLLDTARDSFSGIVDKFKYSSNENERYFFEYIESLSEAVDVYDFGQNATYKENGQFTPHGYITKHKEFENIYSELSDIPEKSKVFAYPEAKPLPTFVAYGIKSDEMLGRFLYDNKLLPKEQQLAATIKLNIMAYADNYFNMIGRKRRTSQNGIFEKAGYAEYNNTNQKKSVLQQIAESKAKQAPQKSSTEKQNNRKDKER